jgi:hypothetical protein
MDTEVMDQIRWSVRGSVFSSPDWNGTVHLKQTSMLFLLRVAGAQGQERRRGSLQFFLYYTWETVVALCSAKNCLLPSRTCWQSTYPCSRRSMHFTVHLRELLRFMNIWYIHIYIYGLNRWIEVASVTIPHFIHDSRYKWFNNTDVAAEVI